MKNDPTSRPPCIVLGLETQIGLSIVRELGRAKVKVIGIGLSQGSIGLSSRYLHEAVVVSTPRSDELLAAIRAIGARWGACPLIAVSESNLLWLAEHREELGSVTPVLPNLESLKIVLDKAATLRAAQAVGIDVPLSWQPMSVDDIERQAPAFPLPAVLKWSDPNAVVSKLEAMGLQLIKAEYVNTLAELNLALVRYKRLATWPLVQQYCRGHGIGQFFFIKDGKAVRHFQHMRIAEWPPEGGFSSVCDAVSETEHLELQSLSVQLLQVIGWSGVAMVEYRYDPATRKAYLMEVNGRFWGSFPLAYYCGAGFALYAYLDQLGEKLPHLPTPRADLRCRMVATEVKRLVRIVFQRNKITDREFEVRPWSEVWRFFADFVRSNVRYYVWARDDPMPWVADMRNLIRRKS